MTLTAPKLGAKSGAKAELSAENFDASFNEHLIWHVVRNEMLWRRQGTHATRTRGMVSGGGSKPWRQKGTGRARQGTRTAPQWRGGGAVFGPSPRSYGGKVNRKERTAALRSAMSLHQRRGSFAVLADDSLTTPSTKTALQFRSSLNDGKGKLTVICTLDQEAIWRSFRNLENVQVVSLAELDVADVMWGASLLISDAALAILEGSDR